MGFISDAVTSLSDAVGLKEPLDDLADSVGDVVRNQPLAQAALAAVAVAYGLPALANMLGSGAGAAVTMGVDGTVFVNGVQTGIGAEAFAAGLADMGLSGAQIAEQLVGAGLDGATALSTANSASALASAASSSGVSAINAVKTLGAAGLQDPTTWGGVLNNLANVAGGAYLANESSSLFGDLAKQSTALGQDYANKIGAAGADAASKASFKPYTVTSGLGGTSVTPEGLSSNLNPLMQQQQQGMFNTSSDYIGRASPFLNQSSQYARTASGMNPLSALQNNAAQNMQDQALQQYATQAAMTNPNVSASGLFDMIQSTRNPVNARDRLALEQRLASQGRLGTATAAYGGTPEQLALAIAQQEQLSKDALSAQLSAAELTGKNYGNLQNAMGMQFANRNQNLGYAGGLQDLQTAQQNLAANAANIGSGLFSMGNTAFSTGMNVFDQARADANLGLNAQGRAQDVANTQAELAYKTALAQAAAALEGQKTAMGYNTMGSMQNLGMMQQMLGSNPKTGQNNLIGAISGISGLFGGTNLGAGSSNPISNSDWWSLMGGQ